MADQSWTLSYDFFKPELEWRREALTSTGNGYITTRGAMEWADAGENHYPGTYMHGGYNRVGSIIGGRPISNEDLVNMPNWTSMKLKIEGGEPFSMDTVEILSYRHEFDISCAVMTREILFRDKEGRETNLKATRFMSMQRMHLGCIEWQVTPKNWSGNIEVISALDGRVINWGVHIYRPYESKHLRSVKTEAMGEDGIALLTLTTQSHIYFAQAARTFVYEGDEPLKVMRSLHHQDDYIHQSMMIPVTEGKTVRIEKMVQLFSSKDKAISEPLMNAKIHAARVCNFDTALNRTRNAWKQIWSVCDIKIPKSDEAQMLIRFNACHLLMCCSPNSGDLDAGAPPRALTGEHYNGRMFWDEMYIYPFLNFRFPEVTRGLLMYRYRRLDEARERAKEAGHEGAMFPWQSGSDGREETYQMNFNYKDRKWYPDGSFRQRHVNAAIFYNMWQYFQATRDVDFMWNHGARLMLEIARFFASLTVYNKDRDKYEIHGVMGPDEYHEHYDGKDGVPNNAYTNIMASWIFTKSNEVLNLFPSRRRKRLLDLLDVDEDELAKWTEMSRKMFIPQHKDGIISQFEGYEGLKELDWDAYRAKYKNLYRLDFILKAEGDLADHYKLSKQADTLMLWYLFSPTELREMFANLGFDYPDELMRKTTQYYFERCSHCSSLSLVVHAAVVGNVYPEKSWDMLMKSLKADVDDVQGGSTGEGIHLGVMSGTLDLVSRGFMGMEARNDVLYFAPKPLPQLDGLSFRMVWRNTPLKLDLNDSVLTVGIEEGESGQPITVSVYGHTETIEVGDSASFAPKGSTRKHAA
jgi:trehalose/maltose hydrolase-like predicted phosphorylase